MLALLRWWFLVCFSGFGIGVALSMGFFPYMMAADASRLSIAVLVIFTLATLWVGQLTFNARDGNQAFRRHLPFCWYLAEGMMGLGMLGTLVGFLLLLGQALGQPINTADITAMTTLISKMGTGFSTAALTTLIGLACSLIFKAQLINLEYQLDETDEVGA